MGTIMSLDKTGHTEMSWDADKPSEVRAAEKEFKKFREQRCLIFALDADGSKGDQVTEFDPKAERLLVVPPMVGG